MGDTLQWIGSGVAFTDVAMVAFTLLLVFIAFQQNRHFRITERAYINVEPLAPGVVFEPTDSGWDCQAVLEVRNTGNTPAHILGFAIEVAITDDDHLSEIPWRMEVQDYVLMPREHTFRVTKGHHITADDHRAIMNGKKRIYFLGRIDYLDRFDCGHRRGFCRLYVPESKFGSNVNLALPPLRGFNYDRELLIGEGLDW